MILVTVGTHNKGFERLVRAMDELAAELDEKVIIQYGSSSYIPVYAEHFQWTSSQQMQELTRQARVVVSHAAAGAILMALIEGKPLVVVPRMKEFGEHMDNHQLQLSVALYKAGQAVMVSQINKDTLILAIQKCSILEVKETGAKMLVLGIKDRLASWSSNQ